ncbi:hypothetical protein Thiowin_01652 [Thiorhodovibrio winogradskyi]|uniref:YbjN domain-containing protein n=1 Tax=Thiorhodovibrio winogradskyi TaxID=77007 RepID=A0ABZ0S7T4_9GAMM|nr:YbjN domain-containing protein [Thiorhodovibrio winogradskyi]
MRNHVFRRATQTLLLSVAFFVSPTYADDIIDANQLEAILKIAQGFGHAVLEKDDLGDPMIRGRIDGVKYGIFFYGCTEGADCKDIQFSTGWSGANLSLEKINEWNQEQRYGKASMDDEGDPRLAFTVNITYGVTAENFEDTVDWWAVAMKNFREYIEENSLD